MRFTGQNTNRLPDPRQAPALHIHRSDEGLNLGLFLPHGFVLSWVELLSQALESGRSAFEAVNDHSQRIAVQRREAGERMRRHERQRLIHRAAARVNRMGRRHSPSPEALGDYLDEQAARLGIDRSSLVGICQIRKRQVWRRYQDMRRALALSLARRGASGAEIGERLGIGTRAANKLVKTELARRNQSVREAA